MNKVLIVVDMQNDFITGKLGTPEARAIVPKVIEKIKSFEGKIIVTKDTHPGLVRYKKSQEGQWLPVHHCQDGKDGWRIEPSVMEAIRRNSGFLNIVKKTTFGAKSLVGNEYKNLMSKVDEINLVGVCTDICVISNALMLKAFFPEAKIIVDAKCCAGTSPEMHENALKAMHQCQIYIENWEI